MQSNQLAPPLSCFSLLLLLSLVCFTFTSFKLASAKYKTLDDLFKYKAHTSHLATTQDDNDSSVQFNPPEIDSIDSYLQQMVDSVETPTPRTGNEASVNSDNPVQAAPLNQHSSSKRHSLLDPLRVRLLRYWNPSAPELQPADGIINTAGIDDTLDENDDDSVSVSSSNEYMSSASVDSINGIDDDKNPDYYTDVEYDLLTQQYNLQHQVDQLDQWQGELKKQFLANRKRQQEYGFMLDNGWQGQGGAWDHRMGARG